MEHAIINVGFGIKQLLEKVQTMEALEYFS